MALRQAELRVYDNVNSHCAVILSISIEIIENFRETTSTPLVPVKSDTLLSGLLLLRTVSWVDWERYR